MKNHYFPFILAVLIFLTANTASTKNQSNNRSLFLPIIAKDAETTAFPRMLIPLYSCPEDENGEIWAAVEETSQTIPVAIIWGIICEDDDYLTALSNFGSAGAKRLAYVATADSTRPLQEIQNEVDFYTQFPIDGIFFDEVSHNAVALENNRAYIAYARGQAAVQTILLNSPYAEPAFVYDTTADAVVIFENTYADWERFDAAPFAGFPAQNLAVLIHTTSEASFTRALNTAKERGIGWLYTTDRDWDQLPSYFASEIEWFQMHSGTPYSPP